MSGSINISGLDLALLLGRGLLILGLLRMLSWLVAIAPMRRSRRDLLQTLGPLFAVVVCVAYLLLAVQEIFGGDSGAMPLMLGVGLVGTAAALWGPIRDLLSGVFLRSGRIVRIGDEIQLGELRGRVERLDYRRMMIRTSQGEAVVPYSLVSRSAIVRNTPSRGATAHTFKVRPVEGLPLVELRRLIREAALLCHWSSLVREPELTTLAQGGVEVRVFAVDPEFASEIEAAVRQRLADHAQADPPEGLVRIPQPAPPPDAAEGGAAD